jgi:O-antigen ligase
MLFLGYIVLELSKRRKVHIFSIVLYGALVLAALFFLFKLPIVQETVGARFVGLIDEMLYDSGDSSSSERSDMVTFGFLWFLEKPVIGHGIDNFRYQYEIFSTYGTNTYSHNNYIEMLHGIGIVGFVIYYSLYFYIIRQLLKFKHYLYKYTTLRYCAVFMCLLLFAEIALVTYNTRWIQVYLLIVFSIVSSYTNKIQIFEQNEL